MTVLRRDLLKQLTAGTALLAAGTPAVATTQATSEEFRGYWVDAFNEGLYTPEQVKDLVSDVEEANMNAIVAEVVRRADFFGDEALPPRTEADIAEDFDPLRTLIEEAHAAGIEVHAWMVVNQMWNRPEPPASDEHVFNRHGPDSDEPWVSVKNDGSVHADHQYFFDPGHPGAANYIVRTARSIVENYDVDGINLDYIRYPTPEEALYQVWGYNEVAVERFQDATDREDRPEYTDDEWEAWRRKQITNLVRRIYLECYEADPSVRVSADTITWWKGPQRRDSGFESTGAYFQVLQNWPAWMEEGILDTNMPMNYKRGGSSEMFEDWSDFAVMNQYDRDVVIGSALYLNQLEDNLEQIRRALAAGNADHDAAGWVGYSYANPSYAVLTGETTPVDGRESLEKALIAGDSAASTDPIFENQAEVPSMPWKATEAHVAGRVVTRDGDPVDDVEIRATQRGETIATTETTGNGWFGLVALEPGRYHVSVKPAEVAGQRNEQIEVDAGEVESVEFVVNREVPNKRD